MTSKTAPKSEPVGTARMEFQVEFSRGPRGQRRARETEPARTDPDPAPTPAAVSAESRPKPAPAPTIPKITRMLVLGYHFERLVREGKVKNYAEIAMLTGLSRARVTQIVNLTMLAPQIQRVVLHLCEVGATDGILHECNMRRIEALVKWDEQRREWEDVVVPFASLRYMGDLTPCRQHL